MDSGKVVANPFADLSQYLWPKFRLEREEGVRFVAARLTTIAKRSRSTTVELRDASEYSD